jgi:Zn-dependent protease/CBS domain-containing protein
MEPAHAEHPRHRHEMTPGIPVGRPFGIAVHLDWSVLFIFALIAFNLGAGVLRAWHPDWGPALTWSTALAAAVLFLVSILLHELSHALVGRARGVNIDRITLFVFGGVAHMHGEPRSPLTELLIAVVGPLTSLVIGAGASALGLWLVHRGVGDLSSPEQAEIAARSMGPTATLLLWLGPVNVVLGLFNLVPGFPLDGGRVLRAILWGITHDFVKATRWAALAGQAVAWALMALGVVNALSGRIGQGLWLVLIGWFLSNAARTSIAQVLVRESLADVPVRRLMVTQLDRVPPDLAVEQFVSAHLMASDQRAWPVETSGGALLGLAVWDDVRQLPHPEWPRTPLSQVMTPREELISLGPSEPAQRALELFAEADVNQIAVVEGDRLLGLVRRGDLLKWYALQRGDRVGPTFLRPVRR